MPSDEYASVSTGGALKLKGAKVKKHKKKKNKDRGETDLEKNLATGGREKRSPTPSIPAADKELLSTDKDVAREDDIVGGGGGGGDGDDSDAPGTYKTEAERRFEEAKRRKVSYSLPLSPIVLFSISFSSLVYAGSQYCVKLKPRGVGRENSFSRCRTRPPPGLSCSRRTSSASRS